METSMEAVYQRLRQLTAGNAALWAQRSPGAYRWSVWTVVEEQVVKVDHQELGTALEQLVQDVETEVNRG